LRLLLSNRVRLIYDSHEWTPGVFEYFYGKTASIMVTGLEKRFIGSADCVVTTNDSYSQLIQTNYGRQCVILNNWPKLVPSEEETQSRESLRAFYGLSEGDFVVGYVGTLIADRALIELLEAVHDLIEKDANFKRIKIIVIGDGPLFPRLSSKVSELGMQSNVILYGRVPRRQAIQSYRAFDLAYAMYIVGPHVIAASSWKVVEAINSAVPIIVTEGTAGSMFVKKYGGGYVAHSSTAASIADMLEAIVSKNVSYRIPDSQFFWQESLLQEIYTQLIKSLEEEFI